MERIGDLLELLYTAWDRFRSVHAVFTEWTNRPILEEAWRKQMIAGPIRPKGSATPLMVEGIKTVLGSVFHKIKAVNHIKSCESSEIFTIRMWMEKEPFRWRQEVERDGKNLWVCVVNDNIWWEYSAGKLLTNQIPQGLQARRIKTHKHPYITGERITHPVLDPSFLLTGYSLGIVGHTIHAGRRVLKVHALPKKDKEVEWLLHKADEYELLVDEERGIILHYIARLGGKTVATFSCESVVFDEPIQETLFQFPKHFETPVHIHLFPGRGLPGPIR